MKVLVISLYYEPDLCQSNGPIIRSICDDLAAAGHEVTVLTSFPHYNRDSVWPEFRGRLFQADNVGRVRVIRSYIFVPRSRGIFGRILNYLSFNISSTLAGLFSGSHDCIFAMSPPLTIGLTAYLLGRIKRIPFCYNLQDIWPEVAVKLGVLRGSRVIAFFERLEKFIYRRSARIFAISDEFRQNLVRKGIDPEKIEVIPNFVDTDFITPLARENDFSAAQGLNDKFVVLYAGNIGLSQGLEVILDAADELRDRRDIFFLVVGQGSNRDQLIAAAESLKLSNLRFLPLQPESAVPMLYASCDVALIPLRRGITENSVPCKTYSIMAAGRAFIAGVDEGSNVWKLTNTAHCGICVEPENGKALADAIIALKSDFESVMRMGEAGHEYVARNFAREVITDRYRTSLEALVGDDHVEVSGSARLIDG